VNPIKTAAWALVVVAHPTGLRLVERAYQKPRRRINEASRSLAMRAAARANRRILGRSGSSGIEVGNDAVHEQLQLTQHGFLRLLREVVDQRDVFARHLVVETPPFVAYLIEGPHSKDTGLLDVPHEIGVRVARELREERTVEIFVDVDVVVADHTIAFRGATGDVGPAYNVLPLPKRHALAELHGLIDIELCLLSDGVELREIGGNETVAAAIAHRVVAPRRGDEDRGSPLLVGRRDDADTPYVAVGG